MKVFQIGFNKCATTALYRLFSLSGVRALHGSGRYWRLNNHPAVVDRNVQLAIHRNMEAGRPALDTFEDFDAFFDMEFTLHGWNIENFRQYQTLAQDYPDAKFVLNIRDKEAWLNSRARHSDGLYLARAMERTGLSRKGVLDYWADDHDRHHEMVQDYFRAAPERLLVFDIDNTPVRKLKRFIGPKMELKPRHWRHERVTDNMVARRGWTDAENKRNARAA